MHGKARFKQCRICFRDERAWLRIANHGNQLPLFNHNFPACTQKKAAQSCIRHQACCLYTYSVFTIDIKYSHMFLSWA
ncbi:hypothetical protein BN2497_10239 [Janthinobacterium sp. CG23_2]|nr:hypothetical protein BN2497_10239 [Janthinobacterium sp. CG23_2]CUU31517.1 hypothetical protein BN3177_10239 [Janthinobacterium sp. CG23_2]